MDKIICLAGESGSGKTTLCKELEKLGYNVIKSYTTRKPRHENEYGHTFVENGSLCIDVDNKDHLRKANMIAYTFFDNEHYWATREQYKGKGTSIYVIDVAGIKELRERVKDAEIVVIYLKVDEKHRLERMWKRKCKACNRNVTVDMYSEVQNRLLHDKEVFKVVPCDYVVDANREIKEVLKDVKRIIEIDK